MYYHYYEYPEPHRVAPHFGIRTEKYKLIRFYGPHDDWELYDIARDPQEMKNLIADQGYQKIKTELQKELIQLTQQYKDTAALSMLKK
jgi:arylsulfatase A-like enzyme